MESAAESYRIELKPKRKPFEIMWFIFVMFYGGIPTALLINLFYRLVFFIKYSINNSNGINIVFSAGVVPIFLLFFLVFELVLVYGILWRLFGKEYFEVRDNLLVHGYRILFWERKNRYQIMDITNIKRGEPSKSIVYRLKKIMARNGTVQFAYIQKIIYLGFSISEKQADELLTWLACNLQS